MVEVGGISCPDEGDSSGNDEKDKKGEARSSMTNAVFIAGGFMLMRRIAKPTAGVDHTSIVAEALCGVKFSSEQAARHPMTYFNLRILTCPVTTMVHGLKLLYSKQAFWRIPEKPYHQDVGEHLGTIYLSQCAKGRQCLYEGSLPIHAMVPHMVRQSL